MVNGGNFMPMSNYPKGFNRGVAIRNLPIDIKLNSEARVYWVDSNHGDDSNDGSPNYPFRTIVQAVARLRSIYAAQGISNRGDMIYAAEGHIETIIAAGTLTIDTPGITIVCLGEGNARATFNFTTVVTASIVVSGANVTLVNPRFTAGIDGLTGALVFTGAAPKIVNGEWYDVTTKNTMNCAAFAYTCTNLKIHGWKYIPAAIEGSGTQKAANLIFTGVRDFELKDVDITGDFATANMEFNYQVTPLTVCKVFMDNVYLKNTNITPKSGISIWADTSGIAKNVDIRIYSGTAYVTTLAKINWDDNCLGYNADGHGGNPIGTADSNSLEAKIDAIQADVGNASTRTNFQSLEAMIGIPDAANSSLDDIVRTGYDSTAIAANANGSLMELLKYLKDTIVPDMSGLVFSGKCDSGMGASATVIDCIGLAGYGNDFFNTKYYMVVIKNANVAGTAPETQIRQITDYVSASGRFTTNAFGANVEANDDIMVIYESLVAGTSPIGTSITAIKAVTDVIPDAGALTTLTGNVTAIKAVTDVLPDAGALTTLAGEVTAIKAVTDVLPDAGALTTLAGEVTAIKAVTDVLPDAGALTTIDGNITAIKAVTDVLPDAGALTTLTGYAQTADVQTRKIDSVPLAGAPAAYSLASYVASGGTALGTPLAASRSIVDALGSDGSTLNYSSGSALGAKGSVFWIRKPYVSSLILTGSNADLTTASSGLLVIEDVIVQTDSTGLAGGTNFELLSDNSLGQVNIFTETVANLGANKTVDMDTTSLVGVRTVLANGKKLQLHSTGADCTGSGSIYVQVKLRRLEAGATIAVV